MGESTEAIKAGWDAFGRGDMEAVKETWTDDVEWEAPDFAKLPGSGVTKGKDAIVQMIGEVLGEFDNPEVTPDEFIEQGDTVVVLGHQSGKAKSTGQDVKVPFVHVWRVKDGKGHRCQSLIDTATVAEATGNL